MKTFFSFFIICSFLKVNSDELPLEIWRNAVVKVKSYPCLTERPQFSGSGLLINHNDRLLVITSEHVLIHSDDQKFCHEISNQNIAPLKVKLASLDYMKGMALLELSKLPLFSHFAINSLNLKTANTSGSLISLGLPAESNQLQILNGGKFIKENSHRALIPDISEMIEVTGLPVEYGMSGGILLSQTENNQYIFSGMLTHQVLKRNPGVSGQLTTIEMNNVSQIEDFALAIPGQSVFDWASSAAPISELTWKRDPDAQINEHEVITYGPLRFELKKMPATAAFEIGGSDGSGIGGADGSGIGGTGSKTPEFLGVVTVSLDPNAGHKLKSTPLPVSQGALLKTWVSLLLRGETVNILFAHTKNSHRLMPFSTLSQMFTMWRRDQNALISLRSPNQNANIEDSYKNVLLASQKVVKLAQKASEEALDRESKAWFGLLRDMALLGKDGAVSSDEILSLLSGNSEIKWRQYYDSNFDAAVELESAIRFQVSCLKKMGI